MDLPYAEPYRIKTVEKITKNTRGEREKWIREARYNLFKLRSDQVFIDLLTDSGTSAMSTAQWGAIMQGDESYAGAKSFYQMKHAVEDIMGFPHMLPTHQGRAAENVLFSALMNGNGQGKVVPGNAHFDTTKGHIEARHAKAIDCTIDEAFETHTSHPFKGNIDLKKLEDVFATYPAADIPMCLITVTCNSSGGQPVSMENIRAVSALCRKYSIRLFFDAARFAENAYFIKMREEGYGHESIREIVREMFSYADGCTMSSKKDALVNIGGFIATNDKALYDACAVFNIQYEGFLTYGGLAGRDMAALATGLYEGTEYTYLDSRIRQVHYLGEQLQQFQVPVQEPFGGHAIFVDAKRFLPQLPKEEFVGQTLAIELYLESGVRGVEIGTLLADRDPETRENRYPRLEFLRLAVPRRVYTNNHMNYVAVALKNVHDRRNSITKGYRIVKEAPIMRHFTVELEKIGE